MKRKTVLTLIVLLIFLSIITTVFSTNKQKTFNYSLTSTVDVIVFDKYYEKGSFYIKVRTIEIPYREGSVKVESENVWNLLVVGEVYFTVISGTSESPDTNIFSAYNLMLTQVDVIE